MRLLRLLLAPAAALAVGPAAAVEAGDAAPLFSLPSIHAGRPDVSLADMAGKAVYVDFWASWCAPCLISLPLYNEMYHKYRGRGLEVVAVNLDNPSEDGLDFLLDTPLDFKIPSDPDGETAELFDVIGMPTSYLIAPDGTVTMVHAGFRAGDMEAIEAAVLEVLPD